MILPDGRMIGGYMAATRSRAPPVRRTRGGGAKSPPGFTPSLRRRLLLEGVAISLIPLRDSSTDLVNDSRARPVVEPVGVLGRPTLPENVRLLVLLLRLPDHLGGSPPSSLDDLVDQGGVARTPPCASSPW